MKVADFSIYGSKDGEVILWHKPCEEQVKYFDPDLHLDLNAVNIAARDHVCNPKQEG